jgi:predicted nucleotidyltransferase
MDKKLERIKQMLVELKPFLQQKYKVKEIGIFGSYVKGKEKKTSDIDILVEFEEEAEIGLIEFVHLENYLTDLLGIKVDLVLKRALKPNIGSRIMQEVIYL